VQMVHMYHLFIHMLKTLGIMAQLSPAKNNVGSIRM
jgi:hypothetical protein